MDSLTKHDFDLAKAQRKLAGICEHCGRCPEDDPKYLNHATYCPNYDKAVNELLKNALEKIRQMEEKAKKNHR